MIASYLNEMGWWRLRRATPTECRGCSRPTAGRPNWGADYLCGWCMAETLEKLADQLERMTTTAALAERIARHEALGEQVAAA